MEASEAYKSILQEMKKKIAGKEETIEMMFVAVVANGHALLEGVPGGAKTTMSKALAETIQADFKRIQGTADIQVRDIVGYTYIDEKNDLKVVRGPIFTNILLVDELNRMPPKTMSGLLEALEERLVSIGGEDLALPKPFIAFSTQNPLKVEGTEPLPKVLADRFIVKIDVDYPSMEEEEEMLRIKDRGEEYTVRKIIDTGEVIRMQDEARKVSLPDNVASYITKLVNATRKDIHVVMGASPRADIAFMQCGKARALIHGRKEVTIEDIRFLAKAVLSHRIIVRATGGIGVHGIVDGILASIKE